MQTNSEIKFLQNNEIDKQRWDECIEASPNGLIYARTFYLDNICPGWKALAGENYGWVLPVTHKIKFEIPYLYQPPFTQQSGVFAKANVFVPYQEIIEWLKKHYKFWEINWNYNTDIQQIQSPVQLSAATNFILDLSKNYESLKSNYQPVLVKNLKRGKHYQHAYEQTQDFEECIDLYRKHYGQRFSHVKLSDFKNFKNLCYFASNLQLLYGRKVLDKNGKLLALSLLLADNKRLYNIINVTTEAGRKNQANHFLLDSVIHEFAGKKLLFDFEGSDLPGVKSFYKNFGAVNQPYYTLKYNALPWLIRLFKK